MSWLPLEDTYPDHAKTIRLCQLLNLDTADAYPTRLWLWALSKRPDGRLLDGDAERACRWKGKSGRLETALREAGFIDPDGTIHAWMEWGGSHVSRVDERKRSERERKAAYRMSRKCPTGQTAEVPGDIDGTETGSPVGLRGRARGEETETETETETEIQPPTPLPDVPSPAAPPPAAAPPGRVGGSKKRVGIRTKPTFGPEAHAFVTQFREDFHDNVQKDFEFRDPVPLSELAAAAGLLRDSDRAVLEVEKAWLMNDKRETADAKAFPGWALVIRSVANWRDKREKIRNAMRTDGVL